MAVAAEKKTPKLKIHRRILPNGTILLAARNRAAPTLAVVASVEVGRMVEKRGEEGYAHLVGAALAEGTERYDGDALAVTVEGAGGHLSTSSQGAAVQFAASDLPLAVRVLAEVVQRPSFPDAAVERIKALTAAEIQSERDDAQTVASYAFRAKVYGSYPLGRPPKGTLESVAKATPDKLRAFHARWYTPGRTIVTGVGDVEPKRMLDSLERAFRPWKASEHPDPEVVEPELPAKAVREHLEYDREQIQVYLGHLGIDRFDPDYYKLVVMDHILGSGPGFTSRIQKKLRDEKGLCYSVGAGMTNSAGLHRGLFTAYIGTSPGKEDGAIRGFLAEIRRIRETLPTRRELDDVKAYLTGSYVWALERNAKLAQFLIRCERYRLGDDYIARYPSLIRSVTAKDVRDAAAAHLFPNRTTCITLGRRG